MSDKRIELPEYTDGYMNLYVIEEEKHGDYPVEVLKDLKMKIFFKEISVYDRVRVELNSGGVEVTTKIRIPRYKGITSKNACCIDGVFHDIYNVAHITNKEGFPETEITLITPKCERKIADDES